jgi:hypothetical protein
MFSRYDATCQAEAVLAATYSSSLISRLTYITSYTFNMLALNIIVTLLATASAAVIEDRNVIKKTIQQYSTTNW